MRAGDFSAFGTTIYDPATGNADGSGRTPFPNNVIPADRISSIAQALQSRLPLPNGPGTSSNYSDTGTVDFNRNNYDAKLNYNVSSAAQIFAKYSQMNGKVYSDMWLGNPPDGGAGGDGFGSGSGTGDTRVRIGTLGLSWTLVAEPDRGRDPGPDALRPDVPFRPTTARTSAPTSSGSRAPTVTGGANGDIRYSGMPGFGISGFESFGGVDGWTPLFRNDRSYNFNTNATYTLSKHEFRFGVDVVKMELNHWQPELGYGPRGFFMFYGGPTTQAPSGSPDEFNAYAQFLLGLPSYMTKSLQFELQTGREWQYGIYLRDRWQVTKDLTLNLGLRWEKYPLMTRADRGIEYYNDTTNQILLGGVGGNPEDLGIEVKHPHFLPRVGFSYRMGENNVFRGGYGITVSPVPFSRPLRGFYPATITYDFYGDSDYLPAGSFDTGIPLFYGPDISSGVIDLPTSAGMGSMYADHVNRGTIQSWNLTYERRLPWDMSVSAAYVGTKTSKQLGFLDINAADVGQGQAGRPPADEVRAHRRSRGGTTAGSLPTTTRCRWPSTSPSARGSSSRRPTPTRRR